MNGEEEEEEGVSPPLFLSLSCWRSICLYDYYKTYYYYYYLALC